MSFQESLMSWTPTIIITLIVLFVIKRILDATVRPTVRPGAAKINETIEQLYPDAKEFKHEYVTLENATVDGEAVKIHVVIADDAPDDKERPLMVLLHGFPEFWYSWRYQMSEFKKDYRVVALDMRGYNSSDKPLNQKDYDLPRLSQDVMEVVDHFGVVNFTLVAHDWGGLVAWWLIKEKKWIDRVDKLIVMNCPHPVCYADAGLNGISEQTKRSWYIYFYQLPYLPEHFFFKNNWRTLASMFRGKKAGVKNREKFSPEELELFKDVLSLPHCLTSAINYYRMLLWQIMALRKNRESFTKISTPTLILYGADDLFVGRETFDGTDRFVENLQFEPIANCSHWVNQDQPDKVNLFMRDFLAEDQ